MNVLWSYEVFPLGMRWLRLLISKSSLYKMSKGQFQPSMANLGKICGTLQCQPGDLLHFVNDADDTDE